MKHQLRVVAGRLVNAESNFLPNQPDDLDYNEYMGKLGWTRWEAAYPAIEYKYPEERISLWVQLTGGGLPDSFILEVTCPYDFYLQILCDNYPQLFEACGLVKPYLDLFVGALTDDPHRTS